MTDTRQPIPPRPAQNGAAAGRLAASAAVPLPTKGPGTESTGSPAMGSTCRLTPPSCSHRTPPPGSPRHSRRGSPRLPASRRLLHREAAPALRCPLRHRPGLMPRLNQRCHQRENSQASLALVTRGLAGASPAAVIERPQASPSPVVNPPGRETTQGNLRGPAAAQASINLAQLRALPLIVVLTMQAFLSLRLVTSNTAFTDEALYLWAAAWNGRTGCTTPPCLRSRPTFPARPFSTRRSRLSRAPLAV